MPTIPKLLLVEDDHTITDGLTMALTPYYDIDIAVNGRRAIHKTNSKSYDLVVLDLNLPDLPGLIICKQLRDRGIKAPFLILSAEHRVLTKIKLLDAGANDYLSKPFSLGEFKARLRALLRSVPEPSWPPITLKAYGITLDHRRFKVKRAGQEIKLRPKEFAILEYLMQHPEVVISREELRRAIWQTNEEAWANSLDVHINRLRHKLDKPFGVSLIKTVHGRGYLLSDQSSTAAKLTKAYD